MALPTLIDIRTVWSTDLVQHHVLGPQARLDRLVAPRPADSKHALEHQEVFDNLMGMTGGVFADRLVHQTQGELPGLERVRVVRFGRAAGADVAHLRALQFGKQRVPGKASQSKRLSVCRPMKVRISL